VFLLEGINPTSHYLKILVQPGSLDQYMPSASHKVEYLQGKGFLPWQQN
jgi:hypothetical protein